MHIKLHFLKKDLGKVNKWNKIKLNYLESNFESVLGRFGVGLPESFLSHFWVTLILSAIVAHNQRFLQRCCSTHCILLGHWNKERQ